MPVIPYVKQTWTDGVSALSAARMAVLESGIFETSLAPAVRVTHNANQSIASATLTKLAFNTERFDTAAGTADTQHDTATNNTRLTCRYAGIYQITGQAEWATNPGSVSGVVMQILLNNTTVIAHPFAGNTDIRHWSVSTLWQLAVNDYVELQVQQTTGSAINILTASSYSPEFMMVRVG